MTGFGLIGAVLMAILSTAYLKQIPGQQDIAQLKKDLRGEYEAYLDPEEPIEVRIVPPARRGAKLSLSIRCVARKGMRAGKPAAIENTLDEIARRTLTHPNWRGKVGSVAVIHNAEPKVECRLVAEGSGDQPAVVGYGSLSPTKGKG